MALLKTSLLTVLLGALNVHGYILQGIAPLGNGYIRKDPIVDTGMTLGNHTHLVSGSSAFDSTITTAKLRAGACTTVPIAEDHSNYWVPTMWFQWKNGSYSSLTGSFVIYYLFDENAKVTAFPDDFRMISGTHTLRDYDPNSFAQRAVTHMCLDFNGVSKTYNHLPSNTICASGIRSQLNFPSCWDGKNLDSPDHKSHVAFPSTGPDSGTCNDSAYPVTLPRIFIETYWDTSPWNDKFDQAMSSEQPFVLSMGDRTGYGWHGDFFNGWEEGVLQNVVDKCDCTIAGFGDPTCCGEMGVVNYRTTVPQCNIADPSTEQVTGLLDKLPGGNIATGLIAINDGEIYANGTWNLAVPLSQQPAPVVLPGSGNAIVAPASSAAASATSSVKATSSAISSAKSTSIVSSTNVISTASAVKTPIMSAVPSSSIGHVSVAPSSVSASKSAASSVSAASSSVVKASPTPIGSSSGSSSGSGSSLSSGGNGNSDTWTTGGGSSGSSPVDSSSSSSSSAASSASASSSSNNASYGSSSTSGGSQSSSNGASSSSNNSNSNSGSAADNQAPAQNAPSAASSGSSNSATSNSGVTQVAQASATSSPCSPQETSWTSASSGGNGVVSSSGSSSQSSNTSSGSSSGNSGNNGVGSYSSSSQNSNAGTANTSSGSSSGNSGGNGAGSSESSSSSSSGGNWGANSSSSSSSSESSNPGSTSGSDSGSDSSASGSGSSVVSNQPVPAPPSATGAAVGSTNSVNSSSGTSNNAAKCKNRHASSLEARAAKAAPIKHAVISSHHSRSRAFNRLRNTGDILA